MKKILFLLLFSAVSWHCRAQHTFAPIGAEWWYYEEALEWDGGTGMSQTHFTFNTKSVKDTIVNNIGCRMLKTTIAKKTNSISGGFDAYAKDFFFYDNIDTAFIYNENFGRFTPLYVFNAQEGDTICLPVPPTPNTSADLRMNPISGDTSFCFVIDSVRVRLYDTSHLRTFYTHALTDNGSGELAFAAYNWGPGVSYSSAPVTGHYTEHIIGEFIPTRIIRCVDCWSYTYAPNGNIRCYQDSFYTIKQVSYSCDSLPDIPLGIKEIRFDRSRITISPNPSSGHFTIEFKQPFTTATAILIKDINSRTIKTSVLPPGNTTWNIDMDEVPAGIYFMMLSNGEVYYYHKLVVRP